MIRTPIYQEKEILCYAGTMLYIDKNCDVCFEIEERSWICLYNIFPKGKIYYYDIRRIEYNDSYLAYRELKKIFFLEEVTIVK